MNSFVVTVPLKSDGEWVYAVDASPKIEVMSSGETQETDETTVSEETTDFEEGSTEVEEPTDKEEVTEPEATTEEEPTEPAEAVTVTLDVSAVFPEDADTSPPRGRGIYTGRGGILQKASQGSHCIVSG